MTSINSDEFTDALYNYYNIKSQYNFNTKKGISDFKKKVKSGDIGINEVFKPKCINCERRVGSNFYTTYNPELDNRNLMAICGDKENPCELNININVGYCNSLQEDLKEIESLIQNIKNDIIYDKNNTMFGYILKDKALKNFETFKNDISEYTDRLKIDLEQYEMIINNKNATEQIKITEFDINVNIDQIKSLMNEYNKTNNTQFVLDVVELYQNTLRPNLDKLRNLKYKYNFVEFHDSTLTYRLFQLPYSIETFERCYGDPKIISFKYKPGLYNINNPKLQNPEPKKIKPKKTKPQNLGQNLEPANKTKKIKPIVEKKTKTLKVPQIPTKNVPDVIDNESLLNSIFGVDSVESNMSINDEAELNNDILKETEHTNTDF